MKRQAATPTSEYKLIEMPAYYGVPLKGRSLEVARAVLGAEAQLTALGALGWTLASVVQAHGDRPAIVILARPTGVTVIDVEVPEQSAVTGVQLVPGNGGPVNANRGPRG